MKFRPTPHMVCSVALVPYYDTTPKKPWWDHGLQGVKSELK